MKQKIQFTGKNLNEVFPLPCVRAIEKTEGGKPILKLFDYDDDNYHREYGEAKDRWLNSSTDEEMYEDMRAFSRKYPTTVKIGDCLVEQDDGSWRVEQGKKVDVLDNKINRLEEGDD